MTNENSAYIIRDTEIKERTNERRKEEKKNSSVLFFECMVFRYDGTGFPLIIWSRVTWFSRQSVEKYICCDSLAWKRRKNKPSTHNVSLRPENHSKCCVMGKNPMRRREKNKWLMDIDSDDFLLAYIHIWVLINGYRMSTAVFKHYGVEWAPLFVISITFWVRIFMRCVRRQNKKTDGFFVFFGFIITIIIDVTLLL